MRILAVKVVRTLASQFKYALKRADGRNVFSRTYSGALDTVCTYQISGWAACKGSNAPLRVGLFAGEVCLRAVLACAPRDDVAATGKAPRTSGYVFYLDRVERLCIQHHGSFTIRIMVDGNPKRLCGYILSKTDRENWNSEHKFEKQKPFGAALKVSKNLGIDPETLGDALHTMVTAQLQDGVAPSLDAAAFPSSKVLPKLIGGHSDVAPNIDTDTSGSALDFPFLVHAWHRWGGDCTQTPEVPDDFGLSRLLWYLKTIGPRHASDTLPLSPDAVTALNAPASAGDGGTVAMALLQSTETCNAGKDHRVFRWINEDSVQYGVQKALVREADRAFMRERVTTGPWPLSRFSVHLHGSISSLAGDNIEDPGVRLRVLLHLLVRAQRRPHLSEYILQENARALLKKEPDGTCIFTAFVGELCQASLGDTAAQIRSAAVSNFTKSCRGHGDERQSPTSPSPAQRLHRPEGDYVDVQLIGPLHKASGLGTATRISQGALGKTGLSCNSVPVAVDDPSPVLEGTPRNSLVRSKVNLIHLNAEALPDFAVTAPDTISDAYNIGFFFWELDHPARCHQLGVELLDEIWVASEFCKATYERTSNIPVINMGSAVNAVTFSDRSTNQTRARDRLRKQFGLSSDCFVCFTSFDSFSYIARKNPEATISAFARAFSDHPNSALIVKTHNRTQVADFAQVETWKRIEVLCKRAGTVIFVDETLAQSEVLSMISGADCYISLHRAEGWGFGMIEAMQLGVPVVCTGYSGNLEFCREDTAYLVKHRLIPVPSAAYPFADQRHKWADPDIDHAAIQLRRLRENHKERAKRILAAKALVEEHFSMTALSERYAERLSGIMKILDNKCQKIDPKAA